MFDLNKNIPLQSIKTKDNKNIKLYLLRLDQTDAFISGNKWFKLKYNLGYAKEKHYTTILTFGGAYSNHIHATAYAAYKNGFNSIGIIRGERPENFNTTLSFAQNLGMKLHFVNRMEYRKRNQPDYIHHLLDNFSNQYPSIYLIPEGGSNKLAVKGCAEIIKLISIDFDFLCAPCGSGGTLAGLIKGCSLLSQKHILGFSALKGGDFLSQSISELLENMNSDQWTINTDYHFGGFAKTSDELLAFMEQFYQQQKIKLDYVYTGKMMYGILDLINKDYFPDGSTIVAVHTGGLQGNQERQLYENQ